MARMAPAGPPAADAKSIAVLPFADLSRERDQEYFCDGMVEELINALAHIKDLRVIARTSAFAFRGKEQDKDHMNIYWQIPAEERDISDHWPVVADFNLK